MSFCLDTDWTDPEMLPALVKCKITCACDCNMVGIVSLLKRYSSMVLTVFVLLPEVSQVACNRHHTTV